MAYDPQVVQAARQQLEQRRTAAYANAAALRAEACEKIPRLAEIERELAAAIPRLTQVILTGNDAAAITRIRQENLSLQNEMAILLQEAGYTANNFEPRFACPKCEDTGYADGRMCDCYRRLLQEQACKRLSALSSLKLTDFDSLDPSVYDGAVDPKLGTSPRQRMLDIIAYCRAYADHFSPDAGSLLLQGATGTGKTHLSLAIAQAVTRRGYRVVYGSLHPLLRQLESEHFGRSVGDTEEQLISCDLLVLDDLGMELDSPFYRSCIYNILNSRLLEHRPTIVSTNLSYTALQERYGDQIASRMIGGFEPLVCVGKDIRQILRRRAMG